MDAKNYRSKIDINDVERFYGMMDDVSAARGILVCPSGWTDGAKRRAEGYIGLNLLTREEAENYSEYLLADICNCCKKGIVFFDNDPFLNLNGLWNIFRTGKCDHCYSFNVRCWDCGEHFGIRDGDELKCGCGFIWYVSPTDEHEENNGELESLTAYLLLCISGTSDQSELSPSVLCLDRRRGK